MVLANPEIAKLPAWIIALVAAGGLAAALLTAAGLLLVISTSISHDLLKKVINPNITEKQELTAARLAAGVAVVIAARHSSSRICCGSGSLCLWTCRGIFLTHFIAGHFFKTYEQRRRYFRHDYRASFYRRVYHLFPIYQDRPGQCRSLALSN